MTWPACITDDAAFSCEKGFTIIEVLITMVVLALAMGAIVTVLTTTEGLASNSIDRQDSIQEAETGLYRMTRELRQGTLPNGNTLPTVAGDQMDLVVGDQRLFYDCTVASGSYHRCVRYSTTTLSARPGPGCGACANLTATTVIDRLTNGTGGNGTPVFTPNSSASPSHYAVTVSVPSKGEKKGGFKSDVVFNDAIYLRNAPVPVALGGSFLGGQ